MASECPHHPRPQFRECHHIDSDFVAVYRDQAGAWLTTYGSLEHRGSMTTWATEEEIAYQIGLMRGRAGL